MPPCIRDHLTNDLLLLFFIFDSDLLIIRISNDTSFGNNLTKIMTYLDSIVFGISTLAEKLAKDGYKYIIVSNVPPAQVSSSFIKSQLLNHAL